jgi:hypothetical protein
MIGRLWGNVATAVAVIFLAGLAAGAEPRIHRILPTGGQRGTELSIAIEGDRLKDAQEVLCYEPGIAIKGLEAGNTNRIKARLAIAPDCSLGVHALRIRTASGISNLVTFSVGALREIDEVEPNNDFRQAQPIPLGVTINGVVQNEDVDYFVVEAQKGQRLSAEVEGLRLGIDFFDPHLAIFNSQHFVLASADDTMAVWQDAICSIRVPEDGKYYIEVRESSYGGSDRCRYRLHVGQFPRPLAVYPAGGKPGQTVPVRWLGDVTGPWTENIQLPAASPLDYRHPAQDPQGVSPWPLPMRVSRLENVLEREPNDTPAEATPFTAPAALNGILEKPGDVDYFKFHANRGTVYDVRVFARSLRTPVDSVLTILRSKGGVVASNDDSNGPDSYLRFTAPADDDYLIQITDHLHAGGSEYVYRIEVAPVEPQLSLSLPEREQYVDMTIAVPQGNRVAAMLNVQREDFGGKVEVQFKNLPAGVTAEISPFAENEGSVPVIFSAAANAPVAGALVDVTGRATLGKLTVEGRLRQRTSLVRGNNNREVWGYTAERMALAVTEAIPYSLEIVEPKAPLIQNGSIALKVRAQRKAGFDAPITLALLYFPPGVSSANSVTIGKGESEAQIPLTADGSARIGTARITVLGTAAVGDGSVTVAAPLASLTVGEPYFKFAFTPVTVQQGQATQLVVGINKLKDFAGPVKAELVGLPGEVTSEPREFGPQVKEIIFPLSTTAKSPVGRHKTIYCKAVVSVAGEPVTLTLDGGDLRIQRPLGANVAQAAKAKPAAAPVAPAAAEIQRLDRLEQLRQAKKAAAKP